MTPMSEHHLPLTPTELLSYMRAQPWAIEASVTPQGAPHTPRTQKVIFNLTV